jgi:hypothetical protein
MGQKTMRAPINERKATGPGRILTRLAAGVVLLWGTAPAARQPAEGTPMQEQNPRAEAQAPANSGTEPEARPSAGPQQRMQTDWLIPRGAPPQPAPPAHRYRLPGATPYGQAPYGRGPYQPVPYDGRFPSGPAGQ